MTTYFTDFEIGWLKVHFQVHWGSFMLGFTIGLGSLRTFAICLGPFAAMITVAAAQDEPKH